MKIKIVFLFSICVLFLGNGFSIYSVEQVQGEAEYVCNDDNDCPGHKPFCNLEGICVECNYIDGDEFFGCDDGEVCLGYKCERF